MCSDVQKNLFFSTDVKKHIAEADCVFVRRAAADARPPDSRAAAPIFARRASPPAALLFQRQLCGCAPRRACAPVAPRPHPAVCLRSVNTPTKQHGIGAGKAADLAYWESAARTIAAVSTTPKIIVEKVRDAPKP